MVVSEESREKETRFRWPLGLWADDEGADGMCGGDIPAMAAGKGRPSQRLAWVMAVPCRNGWLVVRLCSPRVGARWLCIPIGLLMSCTDTPLNSLSDRLGRPVDNLLFVQEDRTSSLLCKTF